MHSSYAQFIESLPQDWPTVHSTGGIKFFTKQSAIYNDRKVLGNMEQRK